MRSPTRVIAAAALLAFTSYLPAYSQGTNIDLSEGSPIGTEEDIGREYTLENHGAWQIRCIRTADTQIDPCTMYQLLKDDVGTDVAEATVFHIGENDLEAAMTITTPLATLLTPQLTFFVDQENGRRYPFAFCTQQGCIVRAVLTKEGIDELKAGLQAQIEVVAVAAPSAPIRLGMSLEGFTAGYNRITELNTLGQTQN